VAEGAQVAQMIGDAFELQVQRTQPRGARWDIDVCDSLQCLTVGPREGHCRIPRDPCSEAVSFQKGQLCETLFDALVNVTEMLLESQDLLTDYREAKMPGLDSARMHRADGNFVDTLALDAHELVGVDGGF